MKVIAAVATVIAICLAGCSGFEADTALSRALTALRDGDRETFLRAKDDAIAAQRAASKVGYNRCDTKQSEYLQKLGQATLVRKLDKARIFQLR